MSSLSFLPFLIVTVLGEVNTQNTATCTCPEPAIEGDPVVLKCVYNEDMEKEKKGFYIVQRQSGKEAVIVAICDWSGEGDSLSCNLKSGYNVTVRGNSVILNISSVKQEHVGVYMCNKLPAEKNADVKGCTLTVQARQKRRLDISCQKHGEEVASVTCTFPKDLNFNSIILEKHDLSARRNKVEIMQCFKDKEVCEVKHRGYWFSSSNSTHTKSKGVTLPAKDVSKGGFYVCRTDADHNYHEMCILTLDNGPHKPKETEESLTSVTAPLYVIFGCIVLAVIIFLIFLLRRRFRKRKHRRPGASPDSLDDEAVVFRTDTESGSGENTFLNGQTPNG